MRTFERSAALRSVWYLPMIRKIFLAMTLTTNDLVASSKFRRKKDAQLSGLEHFSDIHAKVLKYLAIS